MAFQHDTQLVGDGPHHLHARGESDNRGGNVECSFSRIPKRSQIQYDGGSGEAVAYAMFNLEDRGPMIIEPGEKVYAGMIIGIHSRDNDLEVNVLKGKQLTNIRAAGKDEAVKLTPPIRMTLDRALSWIQDDELMEVTPKNIRLRKMYLDANDRKRFEKTKAAL